MKDKRRGIKGFGLVSRAFFQDFCEGFVSLYFARILDVFFFGFRNFFGGAVYDGTRYFLLFGRYRVLVFQLVCVRLTLLFGSDSVKLLFHFTFHAQALLLGSFSIDTRQKME